MDDLDLDASVAEVLRDPASVKLRGLALQEVAAVVAALEKEFAAGRERVQDRPTGWHAEVIGRVLMGHAIGRSSWDPSSVWSRSVRAVVNERVRNRGPTCTCGPE